MVVAPGVVAPTVGVAAEKVGVATSTTVAEETAVAEAEEARLALVVARDAKGRRRTR